MADTKSMLLGHLTLSILSSFFFFSIPTTISCREHYCLCGFLHYKVYSYFTPSMIHVYLQYLFLTDVFGFFHDFDASRHPFPSGFASARCKVYSSSANFWNCSLFMNKEKMGREVHTICQRREKTHTRPQLKGLKVWWQYATLFVYFWYFITDIQSSNHIYTIYSPSPLSISSSPVSSVGQNSLWCRAENWTRARLPASRRNLANSQQQQLP